MKNADVAALGRVRAITVALAKRMGIMIDPGANLMLPKGHAHCLIAADAELVLLPVAPPASGLEAIASALASLCRSDVLALTIATDGAGRESVYAGIVRDAGQRIWQGGYRPWSDGRGFWLVPDFAGEPVYRLSARRMVEAPPPWPDDEAWARGLRLANAILLDKAASDEGGAQ
ncbi:MAG: hypothetical protein KGJ57_22860 [Sphingomonadales bacterium]|nr:hypothetical protein [Sphingomonadales bacterium]MDE2172227.1 hypothetical protein [Sphingomonadales bacterium]